MNFRNVPEFVYLPSILCIEQFGTFLAIIYVNLPNEISTLRKSVIDV